jgi:hypothetical protein
MEGKGIKVLEQPPNIYSSSISQISCKKDLVKSQSTLKYAFPNQTLKKSLVISSGIYSE